jgi:hypothetical protein
VSWLRFSWFSSFPPGQWRRALRPLPLTSLPISHLQIAQPFLTTRNYVDEKASLNKPTTNRYRDLQNRCRRGVLWLASNIVKLALLIRIPEVAVYNMGRKTDCPNVFVVFFSPSRETKIRYLTVPQQFHLEPLPLRCSSCHFAFDSTWPRTFYKATNKAANSYIPLLLYCKEIQAHGMNTEVYNVQT